MISLGKKIKTEPNFQQMLHVLCAAHGMNNVASVIRKQYKVLDDVIMGVKKIFKNSHARIEIFREKAPGIPLPPSPCITRWGKWIECSRFYADRKNREGLLMALKTMEEREKKKPKVLAQIVHLLESEQLVQQANFVHSQFYKICEFIANVETDQFNTQTFFKEVQELSSHINHEDVPSKVKTHFDTIFTRNEGYQEMINFFTCMIKPEKGFVGSSVKATNIVARNDSDFCCCCIFVLYMIMIVYTICLAFFEHSIRVE